jgi:acetylornithine deacetylase
MRYLDETATDWLTELVDVASVSPLEGGDARQTRLAQMVFRRGAVARGFTPVLAGAPPASVLDGPGVPVAVRDAAGDDPAGFLAAQPSLVLSLGSAPPERTLVVNAHIDTVAPHLGCRRAGRVLRGRGTVDAKGPAVAAAVGAAAAFAEDPGLATKVRVVFASVPGEEGGAMGVYGTRWLVDRGVTGRLMLFAEPTGLVSLDRCTATMTPRIRVTGADATDDAPEAGHNATLALGFLASLLARELSPAARAHGARLTVAGLHTGSSHNRVYGRGTLLLNVAYRTLPAAEALRTELTALMSYAGEEFARRFAGVPEARRLIEDWPDVVRLDWLKYGIPPLDNRDAALEPILTRSGLPRADSGDITCDAVWAGAPDRYVVVCGPGTVDGNGAHTDDEWVHLDELETYAGRIRDLVRNLADLEE